VVTAWASALWSSSIIVTLGKSFELSVALLVVLCAAGQPNSKGRLIRLFLITLAFMALLLTMVIIGYVVRPYSFTKYIVMKSDYILSGGIIPISSNAVSRFGALISIVALAELLNKKWNRKYRM